MDTTTVRVSIESRDLLNQLAADMKLNVPALIEYLISEHWKAQCIRQADEWREQAPKEWTADQEDARVWDTALLDGLDDEPPYFTTEAELLAATNQSSERDAA